MEKPERNEPPVERNSNIDAGRRKLLKVLAGTTGAVGASFLLPSQWTKPVVGLGTLPAHAQGISIFGDLEITGFGIIEDQIGFGGEDIPINSGHRSYNAYINYMSTYCPLKNDTTTLQYQTTGQGCLSFKSCPTCKSGSTLYKIGAVFNQGNPFKDTLRVPFTANDTYGNYLACTLKTTNCTSNTMNIPFPNAPN